MHVDRKNIGKKAVIIYRGQPGFAGLIVTITGMVADVYYIRMPDGRELTINPVHLEIDDD